VEHTPKRFFPAPGTDFSAFCLATIPWESFAAGSKGLTFEIPKGHRDEFSVVTWSFDFSGLVQNQMWIFPDCYRFRAYG
jgi:hypothetical protein